VVNSIDDKSISASAADSSEFSGSSNENVNSIKKKSGLNPNISLIKEAEEAETPKVEEVKEGHNSEHELGE